MGHRGAATVPPNSNDIIVEIVDRIAKLEDTDPLELSPPLFDAVGPSLFEAVSEHENSSLRVEFSYQGYQVSVFGDGDIAVEPELTLDESS